MSPSILEVVASDHHDDHHDDQNGWLDSILALDQKASHLVPDDQMFLTAAVSLKNQVVDATWKGKDWREVESISMDPTVYTGLMGTAFTCLCSYEVTDSRQDLLLCADIVNTCAAFAHNTRHVTFLCGKGGIYAMGAVVANYLGDHQSRAHFLDMFLEVAQEKALPVGPEEGGFGMSYDLLYGRAGFLWAALFIKKHLGDDIVPHDLLLPVVEAILAGGRAGAGASDNRSCPLMYRWHGTPYWGAPHGLAGILHVLLHFALSEEDGEDVKGTLRYMMSKRFPNSRNYPSSEGNNRDKLVQWAHGATSMAISLCKASQAFPNEREFRDAAIEAGEVVWKNGLLKRAGLADGAAGNAYAFLALYRLTGEPVYIERARAFASFLYHNAKDLVDVGFSSDTDHAYSLFLGIAGTACLFYHLLCPGRAKFPGYEL